MFRFEPEASEAAVSVLLMMNVEGRTMRVESRDEDLTLEGTKIGVRERAVIWKLGSKTKTMKNIIYVNKRTGKGHETECDTRAWSCMRERTIGWELEKKKRKEKKEMYTKMKM